MRRLLMLCLIGAVAAAGAAAEAVGEVEGSVLEVEVGEEGVSVTARNVPLAELLREIARRADLELELDSPLAEPVDVRFEALGLAQALDRILGERWAYGLALRSDGDGGRGELWIFASRSSDAAAGEAPPAGELEARLARLGDALADPDPERRLDAVYRLAELGAPAAHLLAQAALFDASAAVREEAVASLGELGDPSWLSTVDGALQDEEPGVREAAIAAALEIGGDAAAWTLATALADEDGVLREEAVYALGEIGSPGAVQLLEQALADEEESVRQAAAEALAELAATADEDAP